MDFFSVYQLSEGYWDYSSKKPLNYPDAVKKTVPVYSKEQVKNNTNSCTCVGPFGACSMDYNQSLERFSSDILFYNRKELGNTNGNYSEYSPIPMGEFDRLSLDLGYVFF